MRASRDGLPTACIVKRWSIRSASRMLKWIAIGLLVFGAAVAAGYGCVLMAMDMKRAAAERLRVRWESFAVECGQHGGMAYARNVGFSDGHVFECWRNQDLLYERRIPHPFDE